MVYWHTMYMKKHSYLIRKGRPINFFLLGGIVYGVYWYQKYHPWRTMTYEKYAPIDTEPKMFGYRRHVDPALPSSRKNMYIGQGTVSMRLPCEKHLEGF